MHPLLYTRIVSLASLRLFVCGVFITFTFGCTSEPDPPAKRNSQVTETARDSQPMKGVPTDSRTVKETQTGSASFISEEFQGEKTASGSTYDQDQLVAAHPSHPLGTVARVINLENGQTVEVRIIDRSSAKGEGSPIIDLSRAAAERLKFTRKGAVRVRIEVLE